MKPILTLLTALLLAPLAGLHAADLKLAGVFTDHTVLQRDMADAEGIWKPVSPTTVGGCSAVACFFGSTLQQKLGVPIGLLVSSVGGTRIETWMRPETLATIDKASPLIDKWKNVSPEEFEKMGSEYAD